MADEKHAREHYDRGKRAYDMGQFEEAAHEFEAAYEEEPAPVFLVNIAQAHRKLGNCDRARFFYQRYLDVESNPVGDDIEDLISGCVLKQKVEVPASGAQDHSLSSPAPASAQDHPFSSPAPTAVMPKPVLASKRTVVIAQADVGVAWVRMGSLQVPAQLAAWISFAHPIEWMHGRISLGVGTGLKPLPFEHMVRSTAWMVDVSGIFAFSYRFAERFRVEAHIGAGARMITTLPAGNPFTVGEAKTAGLLAMFQMQGGLAAVFGISGPLHMSISPITVAWSPGNRSFRSEIGSIWTIQPQVGLGLEF